MAQKLDTYITISRDRSVAEKRTSDFQQSLGFPENSSFK